MGRITAALAIAAVLATGGISAAEHTPGCNPPRDERGRIQRSKAVLYAFRKQNPCPATGRNTGPCSGYVVDHIIPLKRCGPDTPANLQWLTAAQAKDKFRWE